MLKTRARYVRSVAVAGTLLGLTLLAGCKGDPNTRKHKYLDSAKRYEQQGKLKEAGIQLANALKVDHNFAEAHYEMSKVYLRLGDARAAYSELMRTVDLQPNNASAHFDLGTLYLAANDVAKSKEQVKILMQLNPNNADAWVLQSATLAHDGKREESIESIKKAIALRPNEANYHTTLGLLESIDPAQAASAEQELRKAVELDPKFAHGHMALAAILERKGDKAGAEQQLQIAIQQTPADLSARNALAGLYMRENDKGKAEQVLRKAVEDNPDTDGAAKALRDFYFQTGQQAQAETVFADYSSRFPKSFPIRIVYANLLSAKGDYAKLKPLADDIAKKNGSLPEAQVLQAAMLMHDGKVNDAFDLLRQAVKTNDQNVPLQLAFAKVAEAKGDAGAAEGAYTAVERLQPMNGTAQVGLAELAAQRRDWVRLGQIADKTLSLNANFAEGYVWRGLSEAGQNDVAKADADFVQALKLDPDSPVAYTHMGMLKAREGKFADSIADLDKALELAPNSVPAMTGLVQVYVAQKQPEKAIARLQQQVAKTPNNSTFYGMLSDVQRVSKDYNGARDSAKKAMDLNPKDRNAVEEFVAASALMNDNDAAIGAWEHWVKDHPNDSQALAMLGTLNERKGNPSRAQEYYKQALAANPNDGIAANNLAYLMVTTGQNADVALSYAQTARRVLPESTDSADTLAWVYYYKGTYFSARDLLEAAAKASPDNASIHYHLGMTYNKLGRKADAISELKKAQALGNGTKVATDATDALNHLG